jgi:hypothetical protein
VSTDPKRIHVSRNWWIKRKIRLAIYPHLPEAYPSIPITRFALIRTMNSAK